MIPFSNLRTFLFKNQQLEKNYYKFAVFGRISNENDVIRASGGFFLYLLWKRVPKCMHRKAARAENRLSSGTGLL